MSESNKISNLPGIAHSIITIVLSITCTILVSLYIWRQLFLARLDLHFLETREQNDKANLRHSTHHPFALGLEIDVFLLEMNSFSC